MSAEATPGGRPGEPDLIVIGAGLGGLCAAATSAPTPSLPSP